jgi:hypothetical protein
MVASPSRGRYTGERRPWACLELAAEPKKGTSRWLLARRNFDDPDDLAYCQAYGPEKEAEAQRSYRREEVACHSVDPEAAQHESAWK